MRLPEISVKRPVLATVISLVLVLFGLFGYRQLSVREYPDTDPPVVSVSTTYRGASAEIVESQITQVIEDAVAGIGGVKRIGSTSREESSAVSIEFDLGRNIDDATNDVRDRVSRAIRQLPEEADLPRVAKTESDARPILWLGMNSDRLNSLELTDLAERVMVDRISVIDGVARVRVGGARRQAMRIWLDKQALTARALTVQDVEAALRAQNVDLPSGRIESRMREFSVRTESSLATPEQFRNIVVDDAGGYLVRLGEVARVELAPENARTELRANGKQTIGLGIIRQSKANTLAVANGVKALLPELQAMLPDGVELQVSYDQSVFIAQSIREVFKALGIAMVLVVAVIFVFLRSFRATLIPAVAIPVSVIASFTVLAGFDYSVNVLTLLALVLAIGLVVDDAIVVLENIHRRIEEGEPPLLAAVRGSKQIAFAVIATTVVLVAVFLPISFQGGDTGRLFREFGIAVAAAVIFSSVVALTLTPMLCSKWLKPHRDEAMLVRATDRVFTALAAGYRRALAAALAAPVLVLAGAAVISGSAWLLFRELPKEFAPLEDRGGFYVRVTGPEGASLEYTRRYVMEIEDYLEGLRRDGELRRVITILSPSWRRPGAVNTAFIIARLPHWDTREKSTADVMAEARPVIGAVPGVRAFTINPRSLGRRSWSQPVSFIIGGPSYDVLETWADAVIDAAEAEYPRLLNLSKNYEVTRPELRVRIDRDRAADLGVAVEEIGRTLETLLGERRVGTYVRGGKLYNVILRARAEDRTTPDDLSNVHVRSETTDRLIPLANLVHIEEAAGALALRRVDRLRAITISANLAPDYTLDEALGDLEALAARELPPEARISYGGQSQVYKESTIALYFTFGMALLVVFLALAAQFESFIHPLVIMVAVPLAITGALGSMLLAGLSLNVYSQIGIIMLIGLTAKNSILIVEFANQLRDSGKDIRAAVLDASEVRLRPILMTTISTALGALPLALAAGAGAESRSTLGIVIIGGVGFSTLLSLFAVPVLYDLLARFTKPTGHIERLLSGLDRPGDAAAETRPASTPAE